jgi:hypothetical protein
MNHVSVASISARDFAHRLTAFFGSVGASFPEAMRSLDPHDSLGDRTPIRPGIMAHDCSPHQQAALVCCAFHFAQTVPAPPEIGGGPSAVPTHSGRARPGDPILPQGPGGDRPSSHPALLTTLHSMLWDRLLQPPVGSGQHPSKLRISHRSARSSLRYPIHVCVTLRPPIPAPSGLRAANRGVPMIARCRARGSRRILTRVCAAMRPPAAAPANYHREGRGWA